MTTHFARRVAIVAWSFVGSSDSPSVITMTISLCFHLRIFSRFSVSASRSRAISDIATKSPVVPEAVSRSLHALSLSRSENSGPDHLNSWTLEDENILPEVSNSSGCERLCLSDSKSSVIWRSASRMRRIAFFCSRHFPQLIDPDPSAMRCSRNLPTWFSIFSCTTCLVYISTSDELCHHMISAIAPDTAPISSPPSE